MTHESEWRWLLWVKVILLDESRKAWIYLFRGRGNVIDATIRNIITSQKLDNFKVVIITSPKKNKPKLHKVESISFNDWLYAEGESSFKWDLSFPSAQRFQFHAIEWLCRGWFFPPAPTPPEVGKNFGGKPLSTAIERDLVGHHGILALRSPTCPSNDWTLNTELGFH